MSLSKKSLETSKSMAQRVQVGQVTPADELRELLTIAEKRVANVWSSSDGALSLLGELDSIAALWPVLEAQGMDLRPEAGRWETLRAAVDRRAADIVADLRTFGGFDKVRLEIHPEGTDAPWWHLDRVVRTNRQQRIRHAGLVLGGLALLFAVLYVGLRLFFPVDPKVAEAGRRIGAGDQLIRGQADYAGALAEFEQAAQLTPDDPEALLRVGVIREKVGTATAEEMYARARSITPDDVVFRQMRASVYLTFGMLEQAESDLQVALAAKPEDPITWYELASVYELRGQIGDAIDALEKVDLYATEANLIEMSATARIRRGMLMQQVGVREQTLSTATPIP